MLFVGYGETDNWAHQGRYDLVLDSAHRFDYFVKQLWDTMQAMPHYRGTTTFIITTDHGRGSGLTEWKEHGVEQKGSENIWIAVMGPDTAALGRAPHAAPVTQAQIAATVAAFVGKDYRAAVPQAARAHRAPFGRRRGRKAALGPFADSHGRCGPAGSCRARAFLYYTRDITKSGATFKGAAMRNVKTLGLLGTGVIGGGWAARALHFGDRRHCRGRKTRNGRMDTRRGGQRRTRAGAPHVCAAAAQRQAVRSRPTSKRWRSARISSRRTFPSSCP